MTLAVQRPTIHTHVYLVQRRREEGQPIGRPKKLDTNELEHVYEWREKGLSYGEIATLAGEMFGTDITRQSIYRYCKEGLDA